MESFSYPLGLPQGSDDSNCYPTLLQDPWSTPHCLNMAWISGNSIMSVPGLPVAGHQSTVSQLPIDPILGSMVLNQGLLGIPVAMMPHTTTIASHARPVTPSPPTADGQEPLLFCSLLPDDIMIQLGVFPSHEGNSLIQHYSIHQESEQPNHTPGPQRQHGMFPGAAGRLIPPDTA
ncbi:C2H2 transcription factor [Fusarium albosuccineum]|uniref:C2H2 transcription factor n=1 Tax=Fusarium albosuccineum TaxID=1237068 RepID=A0A8H4PD30_9HYPO|nr:C2H2 transcription factor [Fusarium albosuccineum]